MKILIATDNFLQGGLETHIFSLYEQLKAENNIYFAFGHYSSNLSLPEQFVWDGFHFNVDASISDFCSDVEQLVELITNYDIDVINVHPFYALFPVLFAAHLTNTPVMYTVHGLGSFSFPAFINDTILFEYAFESTIGKVLTVNKVGIEAFSTLNYGHCTMLLNGIDCEKFLPSNINFNKSWALVSRLDSDKKNEILNLFKMLPNLNINAIDVYGSGSIEDELKRYVADNSLNVVFKGYCDDLANTLKDKYTGIIGTGRVALEGLCMNYPVLLIGYGKVCGVIDHDIYLKVRDYNFFGKVCPEISIDDLNAQLYKINNHCVDDYCLRKLLIDDYDIKNITRKYLNELSDVSFCVQHEMILLYRKIEELIPFGDGEKSFYQSINVYYLLKSFVEHYTTNVVLKNLFVVMDKQVKLENEISKLNDEIYQLKFRLSEETSS